MSDGVISFFEFKPDGFGNVRFGVVNVLSRTLDDVAGFTSMVHGSDNDGWLVEKSDADFAHKLLEGKIWIGHDIGSDNPRLVKAFAKIGMDLPKAKFIYDTRVLLCEKFAKLVVHFGLGGLGSNTTSYSYHSILHQNINAIKLYEDVVSIYEPEKIKNCTGRDFHPMISYLMDLTTANVFFVEYTAMMMEYEAKQGAGLVCKIDRVKMCAHYDPPATNSKATADVTARLRELDIDIEREKTNAAD